MASTNRSLLDALTSLRRALAESRLSLEIGDAERARSVRDELTGQIDDYMLPRLRRLDAPILAVVGGSTGAGKSTLVNSLIGIEVSPAGVLRPTTRAPVLICNPDDVDWFADDRVLPELARTSGATPGDASSLRLLSHATVPAGLALLDAPDIDSVVSANRKLAAQLLAAADLWMFVTTAARYADAVPWELLHKARARSTALALVLNRVPPEALDEVRAHFSDMLAAGGLERAPVFAIPETPLQHGLIPRETLAAVADWLDGLTADAETRAGVVRMTLEGALDSLDERVGTVTADAEAQVAAAQALSAAVARAYDGGRAEIEDALSGGSLLRGEVLARWQEVVGSGDFMRSLETRIGWLRDRLRESLLGEPAAATEVRATLSSGVETVVVAAADRSAERAAASWRSSLAGAALLRSADRAIERASTDFRDALADEIRAWQSHVLELVRAEGAGKRATGRALSLGVNAVGAALMVSVFAHTGGLTGAELAVAGGTATVSQKLLEALFGDQAVRSLTSTARSDLLDRVDRLLTREAGRFELLLEDVAPRPDEAAGLRRAADAVRSARR
ncbi:dynamin family protein [soil metagenome]